MPSAWSIKIRGAVQGVGFRPFVFRLARENSLSGWVLNGEDGVEIFLEGPEQSYLEFLSRLTQDAPPAAQLAKIEVLNCEPAGLRDFAIRESTRRDRPTVRILADLPVCDECLRELFDPSNRRYHYPYINCSMCGPRFTVIQRLPYDRPNTTMRAWPLCADCTGEYNDPGDRRFHAQPVACPACGPYYSLRTDGGIVSGNEASIHRAAALLRDGKILAVKGLGGYHLACDARNACAVSALRERKFRKEKPFALMAADAAIARSIVDLSADAEALLTSIERPIALAAARMNFAGVAPDNDELGVMLPYTPLHRLLFAAGAPEILVMTSANRSSEPIAYEDDEALARLSGIADAFLIGERPIARRVDDSVARAGSHGSVVLRRARGYAPGAVAQIPSDRPILALGADLKNAITIVVSGQAFVSQHIGDLEYFESRLAFEQTIRDFVAMYEICWDELLVVHDAHPGYVSTAFAQDLAGCEKTSVQHHRAHVASVLAERQEWHKRVIGISFDGTGYGDDGTIWGGEIFLGSIAGGFERVAHLRPAALAGGDAAAQHPVQAAAGFLAQVPELPDLKTAPFYFPERYESALELIRKDVRTFATTSMGRLFDAAAALLGFTRELTFEGQAAMWLENLARRAPDVEPYPFPFEDRELDFRPLLQAVAHDRVRGRDPAEISRAFHRGVTNCCTNLVNQVDPERETEAVVLSGGVFQNELLLENLKSVLAADGREIITNRAVPPNDGGISLGQAALAAFATRKHEMSGASGDYESAVGVFEGGKTPRATPGG
jgi:hydrogenase maturation protein HypF